MFRCSLIYYTTIKKSFSIILYDIRSLMQILYRYRNSDKSRTSASRNVELILMDLFVSFTYKFRKYRENAKRNSARVTIMFFHSMNYKYQSSIKICVSFSSLSVNIYHHPVLSHVIFHRFICLLYIRFHILSFIFIIILSNERYKLIRHNYIRKEEDKIICAQVYFQSYLLLASHIGKKGYRDIFCIAEIKLITYIIKFIIIIKYTEWVTGRTGIRNGIRNGSNCSIGRKLSHLQKDFSIMNLKLM